MPELKLDRKLLYHGSGRPGIAKFHISEETTVGEGLYLTSDLEAARQYAVRRARRPREVRATVYVVEVEKVSLADLRTREAQILFSTLMQRKLAEELREHPLWFRQEAIQRTLAMIQDRSFHSLKDLVDNHSQAATALLRQLDFDGLVTLEGGESGEVKEHDTFLLFDPSKVKILKEQ